VVSNRK